MKKYITLLLLLLISLTASAQTFGVDGITYKLVGKQQAVVTQRSDGTYYTGDITIPASVMYVREIVSVIGIDKSAFIDCRGLTSVTIPSSVTAIGKEAFANCSSLKSVDFGARSHLTTIGDHAFSSCLALSSVDIPNTVTSIDNYAFHSCEALTTLTIGSGIQTIGYYAFNACRNLKNVNCYAKSVPTTDPEAFPSNVFGQATLTVLASCKEAFSTAEPWKNFTNMAAVEAPGKCAKPVISFVNGKITAVSDTEGAVCQLVITSDALEATADGSLTPSLQVKVIATATHKDLADSEPAIATFDLINPGDVDGNGKLTPEDVKRLAEQVLEK